MVVLVKPTRYDESIYSCYGWEGAAGTCLVVLGTASINYGINNGSALGVIGGAIAAGIGGFLLK